MPPRHAYWTIIVDEQPTSFRAHEVEELLPTFNRLREKHPSAQLRWFERGQLWESRDAAREHGLGHGERRWEGPRPGDRDEAERREPPRDRTWRPGGEHRDPRQKYKDAKKAKWDRYKQNIRARWDEKQERPLVRDEGDFTPPHGDPMRRDRRPPKSFDRPSGGEPTRPHGDPMRKDRRPDWKRDRKPSGGWRPRDDDRRQSSNRPPREGERREWKDRPPRRDLRPDDDRQDTRRSDRPRSGGARPWGKKPAGVKPSGGFGKRKPFGAKPQGRRRDDAGARGSNAAGDRPHKPWGSKPGGGFRKKPFGGGPPRGPRGPKGPRKRRDDDE